MQIGCLHELLAAGDYEPGMRRGCWPHILDGHVPLGSHQATDAAGRPGRAQEVQGLC